MTETRAQGPLAGVRILEFAGIGPAPFCCMLLADLGADVVRIDRPGAVGVGPALSSGERLVNRGRPSVTVDLKQQAGLAFARILLRGADGVVEGFRPGVMERLGLGPADCLELNARLVYARVTGWGQDGPLAQAPGHDLNYIAASGALAAIGTSADQPPAIPLNLIGDYGGGGLLLALGILAALLEARQSGEGQVVDAAMLHGVALLMSATYGMYGAGDWSLARRRNILDGGAPFYDVYRCADRLDITIACLETRFYAELLAILGLGGHGIDGQWDRTCWPLMRRLFTATFGAKPRRHWEELFAGTEVCFAPVLTMAEAPSYPQNRAAGVFLEEHGVVRPAPAPRFSRTPATPPAAASPGSAQLIRMAFERWGVPAAMASEVLAATDADAVHVAALSDAAPLG
jgi:alpha-methylacyl-CoA racemase